MEVWTEWVIGYYSRRFQELETKYSTTEREALTAKEGLVRFQPFIKGESTTLITDHTVLQWDKTYENSNQRLAAWSTMFSAFVPHLEIVHRPRRVHSNVDPLSRLPRDLLSHISPLGMMDGKSLQPNNDLAELQEQAMNSLPARKIEVL